jgi:hypothetical protein
MSHQNTPRRIAGDSAKASSGEQNVHVVDFHDKWIGVDFANFTGTSSNIVSPISPGDTSITVASDAAFTVGDKISISEGERTELRYCQITDKPGGNVLDLDGPIDNSYGALAIAEIVDIDLSNAVGTLATPVIYKIQPPVGSIWHIKRLNITMTHIVAANDDLFGGIPALTNGVVVRENKDTQRTLANWKTNSDIRLSVGVDLEYVPKTGASDFGTSIRWSFWKVDAIVRISSFTAESMDVLVQDNLTGLSRLRIEAQLHTEIA